jgi:hypothetical protein
VVGRDEDDSGGARPELLVTTIGGNALAKARIGRPMPRSEARRLCDGVVARAQGVNASDEWLHWVVEVGLYGSFAVPLVGRLGAGRSGPRVRPGGSEGGGASAGRWLLGRR